MGDTKTTIELNGRQYNAATGAIVGDNSPIPASTPAPTPAAPANPVRTIDGFIRKPTKAVQPAHKPQPASTLMRSAVTKPTEPMVAPVQPSQPEPAPVSLPLAHNEARQQRAKAVAQSSMVKKFGTGSSPAVSQTLTDVPVQPMPEHLAPPPPVAPPAAPPLGEPSAPTPPESSGSALFTQALENVDTTTDTSHQLPAKASSGSKGLKLLAAGTATLAIVLIIGFVGYKNIPNASLKIANFRAGFNASMPTYAPTGYTMQTSISATKGSVVLSYASPTEGKSYDVSQQPSNWNSQALLENFVAPKAFSYQTIQDHGRTIYIYGKRSATWVDGGKWYIVTGDANLTNDEFIRIASSI